jgi:hypothetical protein
MTTKTAASTRIPRLISTKDVIRLMSVTTIPLDVPILSVSLQAMKLPTTVAPQKINQRDADRSRVHTGYLGQDRREEGEDY